MDGLRSSLITKDMIAREYSRLSVNQCGGEYQDYLCDGRGVANSKTFSQSDLSLSLDDFGGKHLLPLLSGNN